jgi:hypothetical protein
MPPDASLVFHLADEWVTGTRPRQWQTLDSHSIVVSGKGQEACGACETTSA